MIKMNLGKLFGPSRNSCSENGIIVHHYGDGLTDHQRNIETICFRNYGDTFTAEEICLVIAKKLGITTITYPLFALLVKGKDGDDVCWLNPKEKIKCCETSVQRFYFRIRFIPSKSSLTKNDHNSRKAISYLFYQMREDFISNKIVYQKNISDEDAFSKSLGLAVIDKVRYGKEHHHSFESLLKVPSQNFIPERYRSKFNGLFGGKKLESNFKPSVEGEFAKYKDRNDTYVKTVYIDALLSYADNYGAEEFRFKSEPTKETSVIVHPFDQNYPGFRIFDGKDVYHSRIEDLMDISISDREAERIKIIHINRKQGQPFVLRCDDHQKALSFVALLDGYFRLMEDYSHSLCFSVETEFVRNLNFLKCHGPVSKSWSKQRLLERHELDKKRNYLLKLSQEILGSYTLIFLNSKSNEQFCKIRQNPDNKMYFVVRGRGSENGECPEHPEPEFDTVQRLVDFYKQPPPVGFALSSVVLPSAPLDPMIYLCKSPLEAPREFVQQKSVGMSFISSIDLQEKIGEGSYTEVYRSDYGNRDVAVKKLKERHVNQLKHFCNLVHSTSTTSSSNTIVSVAAVCLKHPVSMVMEFAPYGSLDIFMKRNEERLSPIQIHSAAEQVAQALYHLQEVVGEVHGNVRCRNVLVFRFEPNKSLLVKLADPGIIPFMGEFSSERIPWLAPECRSPNAKLTQDSDRYAYGTSLWEMYSFGRNPNDNEEFVLMRKSKDAGNFSLPCPRNCPPEIYFIMQQCWEMSVDNRIGVKDIVRNIRQFINKEGPTYNLYADPSIEKKANKSPEIKTPPLKFMNGGKMSIGAVHLDSCDSEAPLIGHDSTHSSLMHSQSVESHLSNGTHNTTVDLSSEGFNPNFFVQPLSCREISKHQLKVNFSGEPLGQGHYGKVYRGEFTGDDGKVVAVAVKCLKKSLYYKHSKEFEREFEIMDSLKHENIVEVLGRRIEAYEESPQVLVLEFVQNGCLRDYLKNHMGSLDIKQLLQFGYEIALGMGYLGELKIVHRDLAARNVLVTHDLHMKIADFGLSRALSPDRDYYRSDGNKELPAPWCAPESLLKQEFTEKTDVWSYGVTFWEILSYGNSPQFCEVRDLVTEIHKGKRLPLPNACPLKVYEFILKHCWEYYPRGRSDFQAIIKDYQMTILK